MLWRHWEFSSITHAVQFETQRRRRISWPRPTDSPWQSPKQTCSQFLLALSDLSFLWRTRKLILWFVNPNKPFNKACLGFGLVKKFETKARLCIGVCCTVKISHGCFSPNLFSHNSTAQWARKLHFLLNSPVYMKKVVRMAGMENGFSRVYGSYHFLWEYIFLTKSISLPSHTCPLFLLQWSCVPNNLALCIC